MRYMMLIYSRETPEPPPAEAAKRLYEGHAAVMRETREKGAFIAAEPLAPTSAATTVRICDGKPLVIDGPFAETKEQLAGYYILDCANLDEAIDWAAKIPSGCRGAEGSIEIRPLPGLPDAPR